MKTKLTKAFIDSISTPGVYLDTELTGFQLHISNRSKVFYARAKQRFTGKAIKVLVGKSSELGLAEARELARKYLDEIKSGINPNEAKYGRETLNNREKLLGYLVACIYKLGGEVLINNNDLRKLKRKPVDVQIRADGVHLKVIV